MSAKKSQPIKMSLRERTSQLRSYVDLCFGLLSDRSTAEIAELSGLCASTVYRLSKGEGTLLCRYGTIQAIGLAAGLQITFTENNTQLKLTRPRRAG